MTAAEGAGAPRERWAAAVVAIHWLSAATLAGLAVAGFAMSSAAEGSATRLLLSRLHTAGGVSLMILTAARVAARLRGPSPPALPLSARHRRGVEAVHALLYAAVFGLGASGLATGLQSDWPRYLRGELTHAPALDAMASRALHESLVFVLLGLVALHVGGVALHEGRAGGALRRMLPSPR